ncbi:MAG: hypothetical protein O7C59_02375 [Rickettsia endosymbiont of Ixodes persulcatus]|nr:hypothetical protein [Rickettsia endosymbiont of Ixodes persulcatus]MCZ6903534.1 hypothetical protein [Rickettsia endosymbiont of Ixodes persulcatus]MCZ6908757.1 hypothetical protein [Rickettsia endosymbiont of Ixodes persulcatus]MCZ6910161.1 hypothetical protein [Rickettsia endosymbiont of Ixodes persulcatus]MCZ6913443.1 hypothetical protein [Rickettsia endosymbiont of Ixodes persulcatus]
MEVREDASTGSTYKYYL